jgi:hypothetical protein
MAARARGSWVRAASSCPRCRWRWPSCRRAGPISCSPWARLETRRGTWVQGDLQADYHLFDRDRLQRAFEDAGLVDIGVPGLLAGWSELGRERMLRRLTSRRDRQMAVERRLAASALLADTGKHTSTPGTGPFLRPGCRR